MKKLPSISKKISIYSIWGLVGLSLFFVAAVTANAYIKRSQQVGKLETQLLADPQLWMLIFAVFTLSLVSLMVLRFIQKDLCDSVQEIVTGLEKDQESKKQLVRKQEYRELRHLAWALYGLQNQVEKKSLEESLDKMARQVAHDIRSPLTLLKVVTAESDHPMTVPEKKLAAQAVKRLEGIANSLLKQNNTQKSTTNSKELSHLIENLIAEKRYRHADRVQIIFDNQLEKICELGSDPEMVIRILSNLIDNSMESIDGETQGSVRLSLSHDENKDVVIDILDTGRGFEAAVVSGKSSKPARNDLGVDGARKGLALQDGLLAYNSVVGMGTVTRIHLV